MLLSSLWIWAIIVFLMISFLATVIYTAFYHEIGNYWLFICLILLLIAIYAFLLEIQKKIFVLTLVGGSERTIKFLKKQKIFGIFSLIYYFKNKQVIKKERDLLAITGWDELNKNHVSFQLFFNLYRNIYLLFTFTLSIIGFSDLLSISLNETVRLSTSAIFLGFSIASYCQTCYRNYLELEKMYKLGMVSNKIALLQFVPIVNLVSILFVKMNKVQENVY